MERLHKFLARAGVASRRACEDLIMAGRVSVNGRVQRELGTQIDPDNDEIRVDGTLIKPQTELHYVMLNKPFGVITSMNDPEGRTTVADLVETDHRLFPVGRLDFDSEGLLLMTDDGDLTFKLTHPSFEVEKEYRALLNQAPTTEQLREWRQGVQLEDGRTAPAWVETLDTIASGVWVRVVIHEGRNRQVRRVAEQLGLEVKRLIRVREGPLELGDLPAGQWRPLDDDEITALRRHAKRSKGWLPPRPMPESPQDENPQERPRPMVSSRPAQHPARPAQRTKAERPVRRDDAPGDRPPRRRSDERSHEQNRAAPPPRGPERSQQTPPARRDDTAGTRPLRRRSDERSHEQDRAAAPPRGPERSQQTPPARRDDTAGTRPLRRRSDVAAPQRPAQREETQRSRRTDVQPTNRLQEAPRDRRERPARRDDAGKRPLRRRDHEEDARPTRRDDQAAPRDRNRPWERSQQAARDAAERPRRHDDAGKRPLRRRDDQAERPVKRSQVPSSESAPQRTDPPAPDASVAPSVAPEPAATESTQPSASTRRQRAPDERRRAWQRAASRSSFGRGRGGSPNRRRDDHDES